MYEIIFLSNNEPYSDLHWQNLKSRFPTAIRVNGVQGIHEAHRAAAQRAMTSNFWVVDADAVIVDDFNFDYEISEYDKDFVHIWHSRNPVNDLEYGYGGVKLFPKSAVLNSKKNSIDFTTSLGVGVKIIPEVANITAFNHDEFSTWRSAFRECVKLLSSKIKNSNEFENNKRYEIWSTTGKDKQYGEYSIKGSKDAKIFVDQFIDDFEMLRKINDFNWLENYFHISLNIRSQKNTVCAVPWMHLNFEPAGNVIPCCLTSTFNYNAGDLSTQTIEEIWNSNNMKLLRKQMINGEEPKICVKCFSRERVTGESGRHFHNQEFRKVIDIIPAITNKEGHASQMNLKYWDFRFSNLCNFKCRSCGPKYSSSWVSDAKALGWIREQGKVSNISSVNSLSNYDFLKDQIDVVEKIYFAGGEPLLMDEHWTILDLLEQHNKFHVKICYNTNLSTLVYKKKNVLDIWKKWNNYKVEVWPSIDEIGERAELIRSGTVWSKIDENLRKIVELNNLFIKPGITVGALNVFRLPEIVQYLTDVGAVNKKHAYKNFYFNLLEWPQHYHVHILPLEYRNEITDNLQNFTKEYNKKYETNIDHLSTHILAELARPFNEHEARQFIDMTDKIDQLRNENTKQTIPEITKVYDYLSK
jgi:radical SAM protein with 4Fe4S-binding SPASM domain